MTLKTLEKRLENHTDKQFVSYVKNHWCENKKQLLLYMLDELEIHYDSNESMDNLIIKYRSEITDYIIESYYNG